jgi:hypothetical protein
LTLLQLNTKMTVEDALAEIDAMESDEDFSYQKLAEKHGCWRSTLTRRHQEETESREAKAISQRLISPQDEEELVQYIEGLTARHLAPTRQMIKNFAAPVAKREVSESGLPASSADTKTDSYRCRPPPWSLPATKLILD